MIKFKTRIAEPCAIYSRTVHSKVIAIDHNDGKSVTNDAENVIADLGDKGFDL